MGRVDLRDIPDLTRVGFVVDAADRHEGGKRSDTVAELVAGGPAGSADGLLGLGGQGVIVPLGFDDELALYPEIP